ncbi:ribosomal protein L1 [Epithele typhae]|uniref:ribosomal protein L1 n=1 Tax=Epithele typhae TaxID=378194 RepID=UPI0020072572|nr:ribosomal protein L1 [Epithele typhae]KAH9940533.1 ribosomal protein L1 [Epithele typhae]
MPNTLIDERVSSAQCKKAVEALLAHATKHEEKQAETQLLGSKEQTVWLVVNTKVMHPEKKIKPARIPVKFPIVDPRTTPICLIVKDPQREYKDLIAEKGIKFISRVVDIRHLKGKWKPFEARRLLLKENGLFLADERVVPLLPALLGSIFFKAKKQPIPVNITRKDLKGELERAISSTYFHQNQGTCTSIKIGTVSQKPAHVLANLLTALPEVVKHIKGGWDNVQSLMVKTNFSAALPVWQCDLGTGAGGRWEGLMDVVSEDEDAKMDNDEGEADEMEVEVEEPPPPAKGKGKKRVAEVEEEKEQPKKKAKATTAGEDVPVPKSKKAKSKAADATPAPTASTSDPPPAKTKEKSKPEATKPPAPNAPPPVSEPAKKKRRKSGEVPKSKRERKPKGKKVKPGEGAGEGEGEGTDAPAAEPAATADTEKAVEKKRRRKSRGGADADAPAATVSTDEIKQKMAASGVEKKKGKVLAAKAGASKSAKEEVLGKKSKRL